MTEPEYHVAITRFADAGRATIEHEAPTLREALLAVLKAAVLAGWIADDVPGLRSYPGQPGGGEDALLDYKPTGRA